MKIGIVGLGHWGKNYVRIFSELEETELAGVCDADERNLAKARAPGARKTKDYRELLSADGPEAVVVCTTASTHYPIIVDALKAGKHVLAEKPLTLSLKEAEKIRELVKDRVLMVDHTFLFNSAVAKVKEIVRAGLLGRIYYISSTRTHLGLIRKDANAVWDLFPHDVSIFNHLLESVPLRVSAIGSSYLREDRCDTAFINMVYPNDVITTSQVSWLDSNKERLIRIVGDRATVVFNDLNTLEPVRLIEKGISADFQKETSTWEEHQYVLRDGDIHSPKIDFREPLKEACVHFVRCVAEGKKPVSDIGSAIENVAVIEAVNRSIRENGKVVTP